MGIGMLALGVQRLEERLIGRPILEAIVIAILLGALARALWTPARIWRKGIEFSAKTLLETAVAMLGASISFQTIVNGGLRLLLGVAAVVVISILASYAIGRGFGLSRRLALLVACGNSICGNSAIAAVAPIIEAEPDDVVSSIAFTTFLGIIVVLVLPLLVPLLRMSQMQYGVLAGLTVYAVPQVLAATFPVGIFSTQIGTLVKLMRVLMLGPVVFLLSLGIGRRRAASGAAPRKRGLPVARFIPWFVLGFLLLAVLRSFGGIPEPIRAPIIQLASTFTIIAMAALGLSVDLGSLRRAGARVIATALLAILLLAGISLMLIDVLGIA